MSSTRPNSLFACPFVNRMRPAPSAATTPSRVQFRIVSRMRVLLSKSLMVPYNRLSRVRRHLASSYLARAVLMFRCS